jgi:hypothetical protein
MRPLFPLCPLCRVNVQPLLTRLCAGCIEHQARGRKTIERVYAGKRARVTATRVERLGQAAREVMK